MKRKTLTKGMLMTALICGLVQWGGTAVHAAELQEFTLDPMVVTAQRMETRDLDTPAMTNVITAADIEKTGATTVMEALRDIAGITDYSYSGNGDDQGSSTSRILVRGFDKGSLVLLNGAPINIMNYGSVSGIPVEAIEKIEIVKGANSVLYGAEALGGVINIITKKGEGKQRVGVSGTVGNYQEKWSTNIQGDGYVVSIGKDYIDEFNPSQKPNKSKGTYRVGEKYQRENVFTSLMLSPNLQFNFIHSEMDPSYVTRKLLDGTQSGTRYNYEDKRNLASLVYTDEENKLKTILSYNDKKIESVGTTTSGTQSRSATSNYEASNLYFDTQKQWDLGENDTLIAGVTIKREDYNEIDYDGKDNDRDSYGFYASWNKKFNDKFSTTVGLRGQHYSSTNFDQSYDEIMPQFQAVYKVNEKISWFANVAEAFELPAVNAHTADKAAIDFISQYPVKPQTGWNYETGIKKVTDTTSTKLAVYHMDYKNKFAWKHIDGLPDDGKIQVNLGKFENTGIELDYKKILDDKWSYNLGATYQNPESYDEDTKKWNQESARVQFTAGVDYKISKFSSNINCMFLGDRENAYYRKDGTSGKTNPDHKLQDRIKLNATMKYSPTKDQSIALSMYNLLDRDDVVYSYEYYDLPFNWTLTYTHTF